MVAVWITILSCAATLLLLHPSAQFHAPGRAPILLGPILVLCFELGAWFYAWREDEGYQLAAYMGLLIATSLIALIFKPQVADNRFNLIGFVFLLYLCLSHFAYALANWRMQTRSWLDEL